jgi:hypothetical protein
MWNDLKRGMKTVLGGADEDDNSEMAWCFNNEEPRERCVASWAKKEAIKTRDWFGGCSRPSYDDSKEGFCPYFGLFHIPIQSSIRAHLD